MIKRYLTAAAAMAVCCGATFSTLSHKAAAAPDRPTRYDLDGLDPMESGCAADAITVAEKDIYRNDDNTRIGKVELRYSRVCGTNWARVERYDGDTVDETVASIIRETDGKEYDAHKTGETRAWSPMVFGQRLCTHALGLVDESFTSGSARTNSRCD